MISVLAAVMVVLIKPAERKAQAMLALKQKTYKELSEAIRFVILKCTKGGNLFYTYDSCDKSKTTSNQAQAYITALSTYIHGTTGGCGHMYILGNGWPRDTSIKLKNGVCVYISKKRCVC